MALPRTTRSRKPRVPVKVDFGHPLAKDIAFFYYYAAGGSSGFFYDAVTGLQGATVSGQTFNDDGLTFDGSARSTSTTAFQNPNAAASPNIFVMAGCTLTTKPAGRCAPVYYGNSGGNRGVGVVFDSNGFAGGGATTTNGYVSAVDAADHLNQYVVLAGSYEPPGTGGGVYGWVNGVKYNTFSGSSSSQAVDRVTLGRDASGYFNNFTGTITFALGFNRVPSDDEVRALTKNPWQILERQANVFLLSQPQSASGVSGVADITEVGDTAAATGTVKIQGTAGPTEADDTVAGTGTIKLQGTASISEADDTSSATGTIKLQGAASSTEGDDTSAATGALKIQGSASITEDDDTVVATGTGTASTAGVADITEADDTVAATGTVKVQGAASVTEADDTASATGTVKIQGAASPAEADDTVAATGTVKLQASAAITDGDDTLSGTGALKIQGAASITEAGDTVSAAGYDPGAIVLTPNSVFTVRVRVPRRSIVCPRRQVSITVPRRIARAL